METMAFISFVLMTISTLAMLVCGEMFQWRRGVRVFCALSLLNALVLMVATAVIGVMKINS